MTTNMNNNPPNSSLAIALLALFAVLFFKQLCNSEKE